MLKVIKTVKDLAGYQEKMAEFYVKCISEKKGIVRGIKSIYDYIYHFMLLPFGFTILQLDDNDKINRMIIAYPANLNSYVSRFPESTISLYADLLNIDQEIWNKFLEEMHEMPFRNIMSLELPSAPNLITVTKKFKKIGEVDFPVTLPKANKNSEKNIRLFVMKKIVSPKNRHTKKGGKYEFDKKSDKHVGRSELDQNLGRGVL